MRFQFILDVAVVGFVVYLLLRWLLAPKRPGAN